MTTPEHNAVAAEVTMTRDELIAAAESIGMRFPDNVAESVALTDEQCDAIFYSLNEWAQDVDAHSFGLPFHIDDSMQHSRKVIRSAIAAFSAPTAPAAPSDGAGE